MTYSMICNIFDLMQDTQKALDDINELRMSLKKQGKYAEAEGLEEVEAKMTSAILGYHKLIVRYVNFADALLIDDFGDEFEEFLEDNIYDLDDCYEYGYCEEAIEEIKKEARRKFIIEIWSSVVDDNFYNRDEAIQTFINGFSKLDLYLYIVSKY